MNVTLVFFASCHIMQIMYCAEQLDKIYSDLLFNHVFDLVKLWKYLWLQNVLEGTAGHAAIKVRRAYIWPQYHFSAIINSFCKSETKMVSIYVSFKVGLTNLVWYVNY